METFDVLIVGGGAAGLMCALTAGRRGRRVLVIEHANRVGKKILMSGGGRCNFTNIGTSPDNFLSANPHFCKSALARYTPSDFIAHGRAATASPTTRRNSGQLFCDDVVQADRGDAARRMRGGRRATSQTSCTIEASRSTTPASSSTPTSGTVDAPALVIATGGLSIPSMGASGFGYDIARQFGHAVLPTRAGLVPLTLSGKHQERLADLSGVSRGGRGAAATARALPQCDAAHPSRPQRPGDPADFLVLAPRRRPATRPAARPRRLASGCDAGGASGRTPN